MVDLISDQLSYIPSGYKADFSLVIDDFDDYKPDEVLSAFNEQIRFLNSLFELENKKHLTEIGVLLTLGFLTLRLFYEDYRLLPLHWVMYSLFLFIISGGVYLMANGWLSGGEIVTNVLELLVLVFYSIGFIITFISYRKAKKEGTL